MSARIVFALVRMTSGVRIVGVGWSGFRCLWSARSRNMIIVAARVVSTKSGELRQ